VPTTYENAKDALEDLADRYLESPWTDAEVVPEIWLEKDALAGVIYDETRDTCVPLRVQRGYASLSALYRAAKDIAERLKRGAWTQVYYLRDLDPSGADAARAAEDTVKNMVFDHRHTHRDAPVRDPRRAPGAGGTAEPSDQAEQGGRHQDGEFRARRVGRTRRDPAGGTPATGQRGNPSPPA
jgi:hypothetical protein